MGYPIVALCVLSLLQYTLAEPRPEFALGVSVPGTNRVGVAASEAKTIIGEVKKSTEGITFRSELLLLPTVLTVVQNVANQFQTLGTAVVTSITTLASDTSGNVDTVFGAAVEAVDNAIRFADETLPGLTSPLVLLIGKPLVEKFEDSLKHIRKALSALKTVLSDLKTGAQNAVTEAGSTSDISATIISKNLPRKTITTLVSALHTLKANVPVLKYTVDSTVEGIKIADQYMVDLSAKVDSTIGEKSSIAADLDGVIGSIDKTITDTMTTVGTDLAKIKTDYNTLTNLATAASSAKLAAVLGEFAANLAELGSKDPTILAKLNSLKDALLDVYDVASPLYFIYDSYLVNALITTLIANANYSQYCFYKYKDYLFAMLDAVALEARECVDKEVQRLGYFRKTIEIMLNLLFFDFEDISADLTVCNLINDPTSLEECTASLETIYVKLEVAFGDMFALGYDIVSREVIATSNRLKICMRLSQSTLGDTEIPLLMKKITDFEVGVARILIAPEDERDIAMMRLLALALCVQSLVQILPMASAKPDFGISLPITSSGKVSLAVQGAKTVLEAVDDNTPFTVEANYKGLQELANVMVKVATVTVNMGSELVPLVTSLVTDVSGDVATVFTTVFTKIGEVKSAIGTQVPTAIADLKNIFKTHFASEGLDYIPKQLTDGFNRFVLGLDDLNSKLQTLKKAIDDAATAAGGVTELTDTLVKKHVKPAYIYNVVFAINQLKAYLPLVKYTIDSTLENISLADDYLLLVYQAAQQSAGATTQSISSVKTVTDAISNEVKTGLNMYSSDFSSMQTEIGSFPKLPTAADFSKLSSALSSYSTTFGSLTTTRYPAMETHLKNLIDTMTNALGASSTPGQITSNLLDSLILTVIENGKYSQFCFNKYYGLVFGFLTSLGDSAGLCFDKEIPRLKLLQDTLPIVREQLLADFESLASELSVCDSLATQAKLNECVTSLSGFYTDLATQFGLKLQYLFELIETETVASTNRFLICVELVKMNLVEITEANLMNDIRNCAKDGPTADD
uniref:Protein TsetseEP domain-containing protein n=1 Tax=Anopheles minimus TaxID=112268 RepID=A0A182WJM8_9DIPT